MSSSYPPLFFDDIDTLDPSEFHKRFNQNSGDKKLAPPSSICPSSSTDRSLPSSYTRTPSSPDTSLPSSYIDTPSSPYTPLSFSKTPLIDYSDFEQRLSQNPKDKTYKPAPPSSIRTSSSIHIFLPSSSAHTLPSLDTPLSARTFSSPDTSSSTNMPLQLSRKDQIKSAVNQALSSGAEDSTWSYDNESFITLSAKWERIGNGTLLSKAILLLDNYLGIDELLSFFYTYRTHYDVVVQLKAQCEQGEIKTIFDLLERLIAIKREPEGLLQTIIAVIASKVFPELIPTEESANIEDMFLNLSPL